jgi:hypothetical protein
MKRLFLLLLFISLLIGPFVNQSQASHKKPKFYSGTIVLNSGDTLACELKFTRKVSEGLLQVKKGDKLEVLTVKDVISFNFQDDEKKATRTFYNLSLIPVLSTRRHEVFVELLYGNNNLAIVNHRTMGFSDKTLQFNPFRKKTVINNLYLFDKKKGLILPLSRENVLEMMEEKKPNIETYLHNSALRLKSINDYITLLDYHATLE